MSWLLTADRCPACTGIHGMDTDWPTCPHHGHLLLLAKITDDGFTYRCPARAPKCKHTHTQTERATMTTTTETAALAIRTGQDFWSSKQLAALTQLGIEGAPNADLAVFMHRCQATGLDPFSNQITMIKRREKDGNGWKDKWTIQTEIDGYRLIAQRAAKRDGVTLSYGPTYWYDRAGGKHEIWLGTEPPAGASVTVYKDGKPFPGVARFLSFAAMNREGQLVRQWATMPDHMIAKCAEAQALRKAFPNDLDGIQTTEEAQASPVITVTEAAPPRPEPDPVLAGEKWGWPDDRPHPQRRQRGDVAGLREDIAAQLDWMGVVDEEERQVYVCKLANKDPEKGAQQVSERDLRFVLDSLTECADLAALVELCSPETAS